MQISFIRIIVQFISYDVIIVMRILIILIVLKNFNLFVLFFYQKFIILLFINLNFFLV